MHVSAFQQALIDADVQDSYISGGTDAANLAPPAEKTPAYLSGYFDGLRRMVVESPQIFQPQFVTESSRESSRESSGDAWGRHDCDWLDCEF